MKYWFWVENGLKSITVHKTIILATRRALQQNCSTIIADLIFNTDAKWHIKWHQFNLNGTRDNESTLLYEIKEVPASDARSCLLYNVGVDVSHYQETLDLLMLWLTNQNQVFQKSHLIN